MINFKDLREYRFVWNNLGFHPTERDSNGSPVRVPVKDAIATPNAALWLPKVIQHVVKEAQEPYLVGTQLLDRVQHEYGVTVTFPAVGALIAEDLAEGQEYPEQVLSMSGATSTANIGKSGLAVKITEEMVRYSQYDIISMHLRAAGQALARHKEQKIFNYIKAMGIPVFDNLNPTSSMLGVTHGRDLNGAANGAIIMDDIFDAYGQIMVNGFVPDTLLMHPLCWSMFVKDPILRDLFLKGAAGGVYFANWNGQVARLAPWGNSSQGKLGVSPGADLTPGGSAGSETTSTAADYNPAMDGAPVLPSYFPYPFRVIVSPFVDFDFDNKLTDIMMFDSKNLGALLVVEDLTTEQWNDPSVDIQKIKLRERYGIGLYSEGQAIAVFKNVKVTPNEIVLPAQAQINVSGSMTAIPATTAVV